MLSIPSIRDPYFIQRHRQLVHVFRSVLALGIIFSLLTIFHIPHGSWALISALMVMGSLPHIGGVVIKGAQRLLGTVAGAAYGLILIVLPIHSVIITDILVLAAIGWALYATFKTRYGYSALIFGITLLMVVGDGNPELSTGIWRSINVIFGTSIAIFISLFVLPQKATDVLRFLFSDNLDKLNRLYHANISADQIDINLKRDLIKTISSQYVKQLSLIDAVNQEGRLKRETTLEIIAIERRMISTVELLLDTHWDNLEGNELIKGLEGLNEEQQRLCQEIGTLAYQIRTGQPISVEIEHFSLQHYAEKALNAHTKDGHWLYSPSGYIWLNHELAGLTSQLIKMLKEVQRLPSERLRRKAEHARMISDALRIDHDELQLPNNKSGITSPLTDKCPPEKP